jgi:hypothetical protein
MRRRINLFLSAFHFAPHKILLERPSSQKFCFLTVKHLNFESVINRDKGLMTSEQKVSASVSVYRFQPFSDSLISAEISARLGPKSLNHFFGVPHMVNIIFNFSFNVKASSIIAFIHPVYSAGV